MSYLQKPGWNLFMSVLTHAQIQKKIRKGVIGGGGVRAIILFDKLEPFGKNPDKSVVKYVRIF